MTHAIQRKIPASASLRVLILDAIPLRRDSLLAALNGIGIFAVAQAPDCASALHVLGGCRRFDIVLCDMHMQGVEEMEFIYHAAHCDVGGFILLSAAEDARFYSEQIIAQGSGSPVLGVLHGAMDSACLRHLLASYLDANAAPPSHMDKPCLPQWTRDDLVAALNGNQFEPYFQPKIDLDTGMPTCVEILARWNHPDLGVLPPSQFIELMEQHGVIDQLTGSLLVQSLSCAKQCAAEGNAIGFALNLSPITLRDARTPSRIGALVRECGLCPEQITIEVTETASSKSFAAVLESLTRLRMQGFEISVDDFGIGYSSLQLLSQMPFTELKIDRSFVSEVSSSAKSTAILESVIHLAEKLNLHTVAEGIETADELRFIRSLGCGAGQGFLLGRPMGQKNLIDYLEDAAPLDGLFQTDGARLSASCESLLCD
jgi:EAL domain-containing protein (putative c-di-GMP-specific phosphodiesterase class I)/CheY-like chemotaxis protein